jgi:DNA ligase (NAD+)
LKEDLVLFISLEEQGVIKFFLKEGSMATIDDKMNLVITILNDARKKYHRGQESPLTDTEYDLYMANLSSLETKAGRRLPGSPTADYAVGYEPEEEKIEHPYPVLSLKDTKDVDELLRFLDGEDGVLSWKLDGISIVLYYNNGVLNSAVSRGDGHVGQDITKNVQLMRGVPETIQYRRKFIVRGEGVISIKDFELLKQTEEGDHYSNPRNMVAGLINRTKTFSPLIVSAAFVAHTIMSDTSGHRIYTRNDQLLYLKELGFRVVPHSIVRNFELKPEIERYTNEVESYEYPVDGLVLAINSIEAGEARGTTASHPKHSMAFKWPDISALTRVVAMEWSVSSTGLITPIVIFEPVQLEGTIVQRANLHNLRKFKSLGIGFGDIIKVHKANKIIPEVEENLSRTATFEYPLLCPVCGKPTNVVTNDVTEKLYCWQCKHETL